MIPMIATCLYARSNLMAFGDNELPYYLWNKDFCSTPHDSQYDVIILGDSVANSAYMPEILSDHTVNLSIGGTTPMEAYYILKEWLHHNKAPKTVYMSFMDFHLQHSVCKFTNKK